MATYATEYKDPDRGFRTWARSEIYTGSGSGKWVPNKGDLVFDDEQGFLIVTEVDYTTGLSVLRTWNAPERPEENDGMDELLGVGPGYPSESYRIFLDTSVTPHTLSPDLRLHFYGSKVSGYKVFLGNDISDDHGQVISSFFDPSGNFLGTTVPVEESEENGAVVKVPMVGYTSEALDNGELVTLVAYTTDGGPQSIARLLVVNTATIRRADSAKKYVKGIAIDSPFISAADPQLIEFPLNVTVESLPMTGLVHYSDGSKVRLPIDGNKFSLYGKQNYVASVVGQRLPMVLAYSLAEDEVSYNLEPTANRRLTVSYQAKTTTANGSYEVKLFVYPVWVSPTAGYRLEYWLYNLDRQTYYNATPYVELGTTSAPFNPTQYGSTQTITVAVDLNKVDGRFAPYRHVQTFQIALLTRGDENVDNWQIYFTPDQPEVYGRGVSAQVEYVNTNYWNLDISCGQLSKELWLQKLYQGIEPLVNSASEIAAPTPTHFRLQFLHNTYEFTVDQWDDTLIVNNDLNDGELVYLQWIRRNYDTDLQLGISGIPIHQITAT